MPSWLAIVAIMALFAAWLLVMSGIGVLFDLALLYLGRRLHVEVPPDETRFLTFYRRLLARWRSR